MHGLVEHERAGRESIGPRRRERSAQARIDARDELGGIERQGRQIVGAEFERGDGASMSLCSAQTMSRCGGSRRFAQLSERSRTGRRPSQGSRITAGRTRSAS